MTIGQKIFELRNERKLSQGEIADMLDVSRQSVSKWETDMSVPELDKLIKLCDLFGVSLDELAGRENKGTVSTSSTAEQSNGINQQKIIGYILFTASLIGILLSFLYRYELILAALPMLVCGSICLSVKRSAWYWCLWTVLSTLICFSTPFFVRAPIYFVTMIFWLAVDIAMIFIIKRAFGRNSVDVTKRKTVKLAVSWIFFVLTVTATALYIYLPRSLKNAASVHVSMIPLFITAVALYIWFVFNYTYTVRCILSLRKDR